MKGSPVVLTALTLSAAFALLDGAAAPCVVP